MVGGELRLVAPGVARERARHDAGAVHQDVQRLAGGEEAVREGVDRGRVEQVHRSIATPSSPAKRLAGAVHVAGRDDDLGARQRSTRTVSSPRPE